jgi:predicted Zn-ribbon and HTH transcriptional regulator
MKESITKFDLESAFKALDEIEIPYAGKVRANKPALTEIFSRKTKFDALIEEYYDIGSNEGLEGAKEAREAEVAQAKLARIEKIVDLDAESAEDLLTSYVGKYIIQCPQCMTLFYKNPEDVVASEEDPATVNLNEICQHCGNESGYSLIGKVGEAEPEVEEEPAGEEELDLTIDDEGAAVEDTEEAPADDLNFDDELEELDLNIEDDEPAEEEEEKKEESLDSAATSQPLTEAPEVDLVAQEHQDNYLDDIYNVFNTGSFVHGLRGEKPIATAKPLNSTTYKITHTKDNSVVLTVKFADSRAGKTGLTFTINGKQFEVNSAEEAQEAILKVLNTRYMKQFGFDLGESADKALVEEFTDDKELDAKLEAHTEYIEYLRNMIAQEEEALENTKNAQVKDAIQRRIDAFKADLEEALPEAVKNDTATEEPAEEVAEPETDIEIAEETKEVSESLTEALRENTEVSDAEFEQLMNSSEFKKPISDVAVRAMLAAEKEAAEEVPVEESVSTYQCADCGYEVELNDAEYDGMCPNCKEHHGFYKLEENMDNIFNNVEELQEAALESMISDSLVEMYGNVAGFRLKDCSYEDNKFMVEGVIHFASGNTRKTTYTFNKALVESDKITLHGLNEKLGNDKQFFITGHTENKTFITESFKAAKN